MTTNTDALDRIIAAHAEQARKLERADRTIRRLRKQLATANERAEKAEKLVECAHDILGMERAKHAKALEGIKAEMDAERAEMARRRDIEAQAAAHAANHPPPWSIEAARLAGLVTKARPIMVYPAERVEAVGAALVANGPWCASFVSHSGACVTTSGNTAAPAFGAMVDRLSRGYVDDPEPQTDCGSGVDSNHPIVRELMHAGFYVQVTEYDSDGLLCKVVLNLPDGRVAVPEARRAIAMLDGIHPHCEPDLGFFRGYDSAILTITSASGKALTVKAAPPF